jgi:hypothetical protein
MCILRDDDNIFYLKSYVWVARFAENIVVFISSLSFCLCLSSSKQRERERELFIRESIVITKAKQHHKFINLLIVHYVLYHIFVFFLLTLITDSMQTCKYEIRKTNEHNSRAHTHSFSLLFLPIYIYLPSQYHPINHDDESIFAFSANSNAALVAIPALLSINSFTNFSNFSTVMLGITTTCAISPSQANCHFLTK